jgi:Zn-dependent protease with chaperone function
VTIVEESKMQMGRGKKDEQKTNTAFKALFIADPEHANQDSAELHAHNITNKEDLLQDTLSKQPSRGDLAIEIFQTHPNIIKRLRALDELSKNPSYY